MKTTATPPSTHVARPTAKTRIAPEPKVTPAGGGGGWGRFSRWKPGPNLLAGLVVCMAFLLLRGLAGRVTSITWLSDMSLFDLFSGWNRTQARTGALPLVVIRYELAALQRRKLGVDEDFILHRELIEKLKPLGPRVIGFDANVSFFRGNEETKRLLDVLQSEPPVVIATELYPPEKSGTVLNPEVVETADSFSSLVTGFANFQADEPVDESLNRGGVIRSALLQHGKFRSFAAEVYRRFKGAPGLEQRSDLATFGEQRVPMTDGRMLLSYCNVEAFPQLRYENILTDNGEISPMVKALVKDKIVLIGSFIAGHRDTHLTPLGRVPGVLVQGQILENLLAGRHVRRVPGWVGYLLIVLVFAVVEKARRRLSRGKVIFLSWGLALTGLAAMFFFFLQGIWVTGLHAVLAAVALGLVHGMMVREISRPVRSDPALSWLSGSHTVELGVGKGDLTYNLALQVVDPRYQELDMLGKGGMGIVLSGLDTETGRRVAIKLLSPMLLDRGDLVKRFLREIDTLRKLRHPGVIEIYETYPEAQVPYYVMEHVLGRDLATRWSDGEEMTRGQVRDLFGQLFDALSYVHEQGFVHRDIKPENIMITDDFRLKMLDFGLAYFSEASTLTSDGQILGTLKYMSPEQLHAEPIAAPSDIFSAGIVLYETLSGKLPYPQVSHVLNFEAPYRPLESVGVKAGPRLEELLAWCLRVKPADRPPSCASILERWKEAFEES